jgi:hypothetical protein
LGVIFFLFLFFHLQPGSSNICPACATAAPFHRLAMQVITASRTSSFVHLHGQ